MTTTDTGTTMTADSIDLVDKDNTGCMFFSSLEHITYT